MSPKESWPRTVLAVTPVLPLETTNVTGTPAHIFKIRKALAAQGVGMPILQYNTHASRPSQNALESTLWTWIAKAPRALTTIKPDVLHCHGHLAAALIEPFATLLRVPLVCEIHGVYVPSPWNSPGSRPVLSRASKLLELWQLRRSDHVIAQAESMKTRMMTVGRVAEARITVIYPGLDTAEFAEFSGPLPEVPGCTKTDKIVLYAGSTHSYQGLDLLAATQRQMLARRSDVYFVLLVSSDGVASGDVIESFGFERSHTRAIHPSSSADLPAWFQRADVLIHTRPACIDNINVQSKIGLYLAAGKPVVATNIGDYPLLMGSSKGCVLADPEPARIADALAAALDDPLVRAAASRTNPDLARTYFEDHRNVHKLLHAYRCAAARKSRRAGAHTPPDETRDFN